MKVALYMRVSTDRQTIDNQKVLYEFAERRGWTVVKEYSEEETAWKAGHQSQLSILLDDARKGKFEAVVCWSLDRLSREGSLAILQLIDRLRQCHVKVISYQESWTEAPGELAELLYAIAGWVARMESQRRSERTKAGMERVKKYGSKSGKPIGRPKKGSVKCP